MLETEPRENADIHSRNLGAKIQLIAHSNQFQIRTTTHNARNGDVRINNRRDILLLLLYSPGIDDAPNRPIVGRTRLVKMLYLFKEEALSHFRKGTDISKENFYEFFAWNFGPFSTQIYDDLKFFELRGFIAQEDSGTDTTPESAAEWEMWLSSSLPDASDDAYSEYHEEQFQLTDAGCTFVEDNLYSNLTDTQQRFLKTFRAKLEAKPLKAILNYVYDHYPDLTVKSTIQEQVLG